MPKSTSVTIPTPGTRSLPPGPFPPPSPDPMPPPSFRLHMSAPPSLTSHTSSTHQTKQTPGLEVGRSTATIRTVFDTVPTSTTTITAAKAASTATCPLVTSTAARESSAASAAAPSILSGYCPTDTSLAGESYLWGDDDHEAKMDRDVMRQQHERASAYADRFRNRYIECVQTKMRGSRLFPPVESVESDLLLAGYYLDQINELGKLGKVVKAKVGKSSSSRRQPHHFLEDREQIRAVVRSITQSLGPDAFRTRAASEPQSLGGGSSDGYVEEKEACVVVEEGKGDASHHPGKKHEHELHMGFCVAVASNEPSAIVHMLVCDDMPWCCATPLPVGDIWIIRDGRLLALMERKTACDLTGRYEDYKNQRSRMFTTLVDRGVLPSHRCALVVEKSDLDHMTQDPQMLHTILSDARWGWGMQVIETIDAAHTLVQLLMDIRSHLRLGVHWDESTECVTFPERSRDIERGLAHAHHRRTRTLATHGGGGAMTKQLMALGISWEQASAISHQYPTHDALSMALRAGPETVAGIRWTPRGQLSSSSSSSSSSSDSSSSSSSYSSSSSSSTTSSSSSLPSSSSSFLSLSSSSASSSSPFPSFSSSSSASHSSSSSFVTLSAPSRPPFGPSATSFSATCSSALSWSFSSSSSDSSSHSSVLPLSTCSSTTSSSSDSCSVLPPPPDPIASDVDVTKKSALMKRPKPKPFPISSLISKHVRFQRTTILVDDEEKHDSSTSSSSSSSTSSSSSSSSSTSSSSSSSSLASSPTFASALKTQGGPSRGASAPRTPIRVPVRQALVHTPPSVPPPSPPPPRPSPFEGLLVHKIHTLGMTSKVEPSSSSAPKIKSGLGIDWSEPLDDDKDDTTTLPFASNHTPGKGKNRTKSLPAHRSIGPKIAKRLHEIYVV